VRIYYVYVVFYKSYDVTWFAGPAYLTSAFEASLGVFCASVPSLKFYFRKYFDSSEPAISGSLPSSFTSFGTRSTAGKASQGRKGTSNTIAQLNEDRPKGNFSEPKLSKTPDEAYGYRDLELGTISVTRELDIESVYNERYDTETEPKIFWARETLTPRPQSFIDRPLSLREYLADGAQVPESWLDLDEGSNPPTPTSVD
jgi:hypothetical protein